MSVIGYIRVSSNKQTLEHQRFEIEQFVKSQGLEVDNWIEEKISSRKALKKTKTWRFIRKFTRKRHTNIL